MVVLICVTSRSLGEVVAVQLQRLLGRSDIEGRGVIAANMFWLGERGRVNKSDIGALIKEVSARFVELVNCQQGDVLAGGSA